MKKILLLICAMMISINSVKALEFKEYDESDKVKIGSDKVYEATTYAVDLFGNIIEENSAVITKDMANEISQNDNLYVDSNGKIQSQPLIRTLSTYPITYQTESKELSLDYFYSTSAKEYVIDMQLRWDKLPKIRVFDVFAARWTNDVEVTFFAGRQTGDGEETWYHLGNKNIKKTSKGLGLSTNLYNNVKYNLFLQYRLTSDSPFGSVYGTYQHAKNSNANTLAISQSYTFGSSGLGKVLVFKNATYKSYYDGMKGIQILS